MQFKPGSVVIPIKTEFSRRFGGEQSMLKEIKNRSKLKIKYAPAPDYSFSVIMSDGAVYTWDCRDFIPAKKTIVVLED